MLKNVKSTFNPKPEILQQAAKGSQTGYHGSVLTLLNVLIGAAGLLLGEGVLMFAIILVLTFYSLAATGSLDINLSGDLRIILNLFATVGSTIVCMLYVRFMENRPLSSMGFVKKRAFSDYLIGMAAAFVMFSSCVGICVATGGMRFDGYTLDDNFIPIAFIFVGYMIQGMSEETLCRGFLMTSLGSKFGAAFGMFFNSILFGMLHLFNNGITALAFANIVLFGIFMSALVLKLNSIWMACAVHSMWNFVQGNFYGIVVSGINNGSSIFKFSSVAGLDIVNGGSFGMEGGFAATIVLAVSIFIVLCIKPRTSNDIYKNTAYLTHNVLK